MNQPGPCVICGITNYPPSMGGPTICPKCDCGHFDAATVAQQAKAMDRLRDDLGAALVRENNLIAEGERLRDLLSEAINLIEYGDERGNPNDRELEFKKRAYAALHQRGQSETK